MSERSTPAGGGSLLTDLTNAIVALHREHFGRGPGSARTYMLDDLVVCVLTDVYTQVEKTLINAGKIDHVRQTRALHQLALEQQYRRQVEQLTGRPVRAFMSAQHFEPDQAVEMFLLD
jgi:uncharacterized protein YbcI